jgi:hypothetical protein
VELDRLASDITKILNQTAEKDIPDKLMANASINNAISKYYQHFVDTVGDIVTDVLLDFPLVKSGPRSDIVYNDYSRYFSKIMSDIAPREDYDSDPYSGVANQALESAVHRWLSNIISENMPFKPEINLITNLLSSTLLELLKNGEKTAFSKEEVSDQLYRFELSRRMAKSLQREARKMISEVLDDIQNFVQKCTDADELRKLFALHLEVLFDLEISSYYVSSWLHSLDKSESVAMLNDFFKQLMTIEKPWIVFHQISNLDCNGKKFRIGDVEIFDSRTWDYGEGVSFDLGNFRAASIEEFKSEVQVYETFKSAKGEAKWSRSSARAKAKVYARDERTAIRIARTQTHKAVATLVFANSEMHFGFRPVIPQQALVADENLKPNHSHAESVDSGMPLKIDEKQVQITEFYDNLMRTSNMEVKIALERALSWFYKGRWEDVEHARFVSYWIALEHLVGKDKKKKDAVLDYVPRIIANWRRGGTWPYSLSSHISDLVKAITQNSVLYGKVQGRQELVGFEKDYGIIVANLPLLTAILKNTSSYQHLKQVKGFTKGRTWKWLSLEVKNRREHDRFQLSLANQKRNQLVHEGLSYAPELLFYNKILQELVRRTMSAFLETRQSSTDIDKVVQNIESPLPIT